MAALLIALALAGAMPAPAEDAQTINGWTLAKTPARCSLGTKSGNTVLAFVVEKAGSPGTIRLINPGWDLVPGLDHLAHLSFATADLRDTFTLGVVQSADGRQLLIAPMPRNIGDYFQATDMFSMEIEGIGEFVSAAITDGPKIWAAMQACVAKLPD
ncbi:MAG: hypothetical protein EOP61_08005 [Sphingomonadales bacterium]|nr:MAG: hypothetical protein EOP61_08005 [Sphingomonadales bacterium]